MRCYSDVRSYVNIITSDVNISDVLLDPAIRVFENVKYKSTLKKKEKFEKHTIDMCLKIPFIQKQTIIVLKSCDIMSLTFT